MTESQEQKLSVLSMEELSHISCDTCLSNKHLEVFEIKISPKFSAMLSLACNYCAIREWVQDTHIQFFHFHTLWADYLEGQSSKVPKISISERGFTSAVPTFPEISPAIVIGAQKEDD